MRGEGGRFAKLSYALEQAKGNFLYVGQHFEEGDSAKFLVSARMTPERKRQLGLLGEPMTDRLLKELLYKWATEDKVIAGRRGEVCEALIRARTGRRRRRTSGRRRRRRRTLAVRASPASTADPAEGCVIEKPCKLKRLFVAVLTQI